MVDVTGYRNDGGAPHPRLCSNSISTVTAILSSRHAQVRLTAGDRAITNGRTDSAGRHADSSASNGCFGPSARAGGVNERTMFGARLCIVELAANTLEHGVAISGEDHIIVTARRAPLGIDLDFLDSRASFDPTAKSARPRPETLESADARGRGLTLVHSYADKFTYSYDGTYNRIGLTIKSA